MFNLLLVDDEVVILNGLYNNIPWEDIGFSQVFRASDGQQALELLRHTRIDVVVSDIMMPGVDGLEMGEELKRLWPYAKIVFLSGYREFEYARRAVELGAYQYIVKPVRYEDLQDIVQGALGELKHELNERSILDRARQQLDKAQGLLQERFLRDWLLQGDIDPAANPTEAEECGLAIAPGMHGQLLLLRTDSNAALSHQVIELALNGLVEKLICGAEGGMSMLSVSVDRKMSLFLFLSTARESGAVSGFERRLKSRLEPLQLAVRETLALTVSLFVGTAMPVNALHEGYRALSLASTRMDALVSGAIIELAGALPEPSLNQLAQALRHGRLDGEPYLEEDSASADACMEAMLAGLRADARQADADDGLEIAERQARLYTELFSILLMEAFRRGVHMDDWYASCRSFWESAGRFGSIDEFERACKQAVAYFIESSRNQQRSQRRRVMEQVDAIIDGTLNCAGATGALTPGTVTVTAAPTALYGLSVSLIAAQLHYTPGYLSQLVKAEAGKPLAEYIIDRRIKRARELLDSGERVAHVAERVGYDNFAHFSRIFKKTVGMSPKQYQQYG